jgi:hypothetical protein
MRENMYKAVYLKKSQCPKYMKNLHNSIAQNTTLKKIEKESE